MDNSKNADDVAEQPVDFMSDDDALELVEAMKRKAADLAAEAHRRHAERGQKR